MSYAVRNTIILLVTLALIVGLGLSYSKFYLESKIDELSAELETKQNDYNSKKNINAEYDALNERYQTALQIIENYNKVLFPSNKPDDVFDYLTRLNEMGGNNIFFDYIYSDSLPSNEYGIIRSSLTGYGEYKALIEFINRIENSQLLNKVQNLNISPARQEDNWNMVNFSFQMESYYERTPLFESSNTEFNVILDENISTYNPLYPLIQERAEPNIHNLPDVRSARLIGMTKNRVFLRISDGKIISLKPGDKVYLGYLEEVDLESKTATFNLNNGGIQEVVTLEVVR